MWLNVHDTGQGTAPCQLIERFLRRGPCPHDLCFCSQPRHFAKPMSDGYAYKTRDLHALPVIAITLERCCLPLGLLLNIIMPASTIPFAPRYVPAQATKEDCESAMASLHTKLLTVLP